MSKSNLQRLWPKEALSWPHNTVYLTLMEKMNANAQQIAGSHYKDKKIQPWDYIISNNIGYLEGNVIKYVSRYRDKNGIEDLNKAKHYLDKLIESLNEDK